MNSTSPCRLVTTPPAPSADDVSRAGGRGRFRTAGICFVSSPSPTSQPASHRPKSATPLRGHPKLSVSTRVDVTHRCQRPLTNRSTSSSEAPAAWLAFLWSLPTRPLVESSAPELRTLAAPHDRLVLAPASALRHRAAPRLRHTHSLLAHPPRALLARCRKHQEAGSAQRNALGAQRGTPAGLPLAQGERKRRTDHRGRSSGVHKRAVRYRMGRVQQDPLFTRSPRIQDR